MRSIRDGEPVWVMFRVLGRTSKGKRFWDEHLSYVIEPVVPRGNGEAQQGAKAKDSPRVDAQVSGKRQHAKAGKAKKVVGDR